MIKHGDVEEVEKAVMRLICKAVETYLPTAKTVFEQETDLAQDVAEDVTREAFDALGISQLPIRLIGKVDFKKAMYVFLPNREVAVALFADSKAEKDKNTATLQMSQTSMEIRQSRAGESIAAKGLLDPVVTREGVSLQVVTAVIKYTYADALTGGYDLQLVTVAMIPSGVLQEMYNPNVDDGIWRAGRNAQSLGEDFRVRLHFGDLAVKAPWRVARFELL